MRNDFLPNFLLCNTAQRFTLSAKVPLVPVQKPSVPYANFYRGTQFSWKDLNAAHQGFEQLHNGFFGIPHMFSIVRLLGSRSFPWLLDHISTKAASYSGTLDNRVARSITKIDWTASF